MTLRLITDATTEPLTLAEAKAGCNIDSDDTSKDGLLTRAITSSRMLAQQMTDCVFGGETWELVLDAFPKAEIELGKWPILSVVSIKYVDILSVQQTLDPARYVLDAATAPGYVLPATGTSWPATYADTTNAVLVRFTTNEGGYTYKQLEPLRQWMQVQISTSDSFRNAIHTGTVSELPNRYVDRLLDSYRQYR